MSDGAVVLASGSPRRRDLLTAGGVAFEVVVAETVETPDDPVGNADAKLRVVAGHVAPERSIVAADTVVTVGSQVLGKPRDRAHATAMLEQLSGRRAEVVTAVAVRHAATVRRSTAVTGLVLHDLPPAAIAAYVASGAGEGKAGALEVQGAAAPFVAAIEGCHANVLGLPLATVLALLDRPMAGHPCLTSRTAPCAACGVDWRLAAAVAVDQA